MYGFVGGEIRPAGQWPKAKTLAQVEFISAEHLKSTGWNPKKKDIRSDVLLFLEQVKGVEPSYQAWEACVLPMNYTCGNFV